MVSKDKRYSIGTKIAFVIVVFLSIGLVAEVASRLMLTFKDDFKSFFGMSARRNLNEYEMPDPRHPAINWVLMPGFSRTLEQAIRAKEAEGRFLAVKQMTEHASQLGFKRDELLYQINSDGFKGPEIVKTHRSFRILTIGDSCTFGSLFDKYSYPRVMERELREQGRDVEVINAGVEGYHPKNVLLNIEKLKALRPEITTINLGWNAMWDEPTRGPEKYLYSVRVLKSVLRKLIYLGGDPGKAAFLEYSKPKHIERDSGEVADLNGYVPNFIKDVIRIVDEMQSVGSEVMLVTLSGIYTMDEEPSASALEKGHLPTFTDNPYALAKMSEQYNVALRKLAMERNLHVIDLEEWGKTNLRPRDVFFADTVHLYEDGQELVGKYMADELLPFVRK